jgi:2-methylisocitrate lyase-like PEP mutase family enzyme
MPSAARVVEVTVDAELRERCERFRAMHVRGHPVVLPNAWDASSARAVAAAGFPAVATSSAAVAATLGFEDHQGAPVAEMLAAAARIARAVDVPVTVDAEAGYGLGPDALVAALVEAGVAGCNLEDTDHRTRSLVEPGQHAEWLAAVRQAAARAGYGLVLNARIDVFLRDRETEQIQLVDEALVRARAYREAGADCVYPIVLGHRSAIERFVQGAGGPVNILATAGAPSVSELAAIGVARVSYGGSIHAAVMGELAAFLAGGRALGSVTAPPRP